MTTNRMYNPGLNPRLKKEENDFKWYYWDDGEI